MIEKRSCIFVFLAMLVFETHAVSGVRKVFKCEGHYHSLQCKAGETISIINATYGRIDNNCVPYGYYYESLNRFCTPSSVTLPVRRHCQCKPFCLIQVFDFWLTNPCNAIVYYKKLQINYECIKDESCLINPDAGSRATTTTTQPTTPTTRSSTTTNQPTTTTTLSSKTTTQLAATKANPTTPTVKAISTNKLLTKSITPSGVNNSNKTNTLNSKSATGYFPWIPILIALTIFLLISTFLVVIYRYKGKYSKKCCHVGNKHNTLPYSQTVITTSTLRITPTAPDLNSEVENGERLYQEITSSQRVMVDNVLYVPSSYENKGKKSDSKSANTARQNSNSNEVYESSYSEIPIAGYPSMSQRKNLLSKQTVINELYASSTIREVQTDAHKYEDVNNSMVNNVIYKTIQ